MIKVGTMRNVKSSLDAIRDRRAPSVITLLEEEASKRLEEEFGPFITEEDRRIEREKERRRLEKQDFALRKARYKALRNKAKGMMIQKMRHEMSNGRLLNSDSAGDEIKMRRKIQKPKFNEIIFEY